MNNSFAWADESSSKDFTKKMNSSRIVFDNKSYPNATVIMVDRADNHRILLDILEDIAELNLNIVKAYISFVDGCFVDILNVTDLHGNKIIDETTLSEIHSHIQESLGLVSLRRPSNYTSIELTGMDHPGFLSEVTAVLTDMMCNVVNAKLWTHNGRAAMVMQVTDAESGFAITGASEMSKIKESLLALLKVENRSKRAEVKVSAGQRFGERGLHQMMFVNGFTESFSSDSRNEQHKPKIAIVNWSSRNYSVVNIRCKDRPKLLFDAVCAFTDMQYVIFHGNIDTVGEEAVQEYSIRHIDGAIITSETERNHIIKWLEAAIERRVSEGTKLELHTRDRVGLLQYMARIFRENGITVTHAELETKNSSAVCTFHILDASGGPVDPSVLKSIETFKGIPALRVNGNVRRPIYLLLESLNRFLFCRSVVS